MSDKHHLSGKTWRLLSMVLIAIMMVSFISLITTHPTRAQVSPVPIYPQNNANTTPATDPPLGVPTFTWAAVDGATKYRLQVDNDSDFSSTIMNITTQNLSYTPDSISYLLADDIWLYWRVRAETPVSDWSEPMVFTKKWATPDNTPLLLYPNEGDTIAFFNSPDFSWTSVLGAANYRFQISLSSEDFSTPVLSADTLALSYQPKTRINNGTYYWRVIPLDTKGQLGTPSMIRSFNLAYGTGDMVPGLIEPSDGSVQVFTPTFRWSAIEGAETYRLGYTSADNPANCVFPGKEVSIPQTTYTPIDTLPNDRWYCWHVRVESGPAIGGWSESWTFQKQWNLQPELLTPTNLYQTGLYPLYTWTPVPGASRYKIEIANNPGFSQSLIAVTANTSYTPRQYVGTSHYYWRVTPIDGSGENGLTSEVWEYQSYYTSTAPILVYPFYYYPPNNYGTNTMDPHEDRTVPYPVFMWHRVLNPSDDGGIYAPAYRIQVDNHPPDFTSPVWEFDTENTSAAPTGNDPDIFIPNVDEDYWWRVCPLDAVEGNCRTNPVNGYQWWSQVWKARFDPSLALSSTPAVEPAQLLRPAHGQELVETTPLFEWWPLNNATQYQIEVSRDENFGTHEISETVNIPVYSPDYSLAQRSLGRTDYGTFYWRVRGFVSGEWGDWSEPWRFQIASQSEWRYSRGLGISANKLLIADDITEVITSTYDLTTLFASQSNTAWYLGFNAYITTTTDTTYVLYIDLDHIDGSGAPDAPPLRYYSVTTIPAHQPEYAIYVDMLGGVIDTQNTWVFTWDETNDEWDYGQSFQNIGGNVYTTTGYIELEIPNGAIGMSEVTGSASISLFSINRSTGLVEDSVPSDPQVPGSANLSRFSAVSDRMNLISPPNTASGDPSTTPSIFPFFWDWPTGSNPSTPFAGGWLEVALDPEFTNIVAEVEMKSGSSYFSENNATLLDDIDGDNLYYWHVRPKYKLPGFPITPLGAWSGTWSFGRFGFAPQNLGVSINFATPTFTWDMVEGASFYRLQVATDPYFDSTVINATTRINSFTPNSTLPEGFYYWRVQVNRYNNIPANIWSDVEQFDLTYPIPSALVPDGEEVHYAPTYCWDPIEIAWKYRLQVSTNQAFSGIYETVDTINHCWTPTKGYKDGTYYWHVAIINANGRVGHYSDIATFIKAYPKTALVSPVVGNVQTTPTFIWTPVDGAATYRLEVSLYEAFTPLYDSTITINTQFTPTKVYAENHIYFWRVLIRDRDGNQATLYASASFVLGKGIYILPLVYK